MFTCLEHLLVENKGVLLVVYTVTQGSGRNPEEQTVVQYIVKKGTE